MSRFDFSPVGCTVHVMTAPIANDRVIIQCGAGVFTNEVNLPVQAMMPRLDYGRTYNVIPGDVDEEVAVAIFRMRWRAGRETVGASYDDAGLGVGLLTARNAVLWGVQAREIEFRNWYNTHYPFTRLSFLALP